MGGVQGSVARSQEVDKVEVGEIVVVGVDSQRDQGGEKRRVGVERSDELRHMDAASTRTLKDTSDGKQAIKAMHGRQNKGGGVRDHTKSARKKQGHRCSEEGGGGGVPRESQGTVNLELQKARIVMEQVGKRRERGMVMEFDTGQQRVMLGKGICGTCKMYGAPQLAQIKCLPPKVSVPTKVEQHGMNAAHVCGREGMQQRCAI
ncbi:hypothetical protein C8R47DRAFT_1066336 [Mycena vitilis]|nr:hypothetical protein C8R47DRAFT_1066336 [Mycena vitilis]